MKDYRQFYIDGQWVDPIGGQAIAVENPSTEKPIATITLGTAADVDKAVAAARKAFNSYGFLQALMKTAIADGARVVAGSPGKPAGMEIGYFTRPTVFADVDNHMTIAREEVFGPVLVMIPYQSRKEAIANDSPYGLAAYIQTDDDERASRVSRQLRAGMVRVNDASHGYSLPFGGYKQSGNGREWGEYGFEDFLETKAISR